MARRLYAGEPWLRYRRVPEAITVGIGVPRGGHVGRAATAYARCDLRGIGGTAVVRIAGTVRIRVLEGARTSAAGAPRIALGAHITVVACGAGHRRSAQHAHAVDGLEVQLHMAQCTTEEKDVIAQLEHPGSVRVTAEARQR